MNNTPTHEPEAQMRITDWLREHPRRQYHDAANYIDSLERNRDESREKLAAEIKHHRETTAKWNGHHMDLTIAQCDLNQAIREREEARAKVEELEAVMRSTERAMLLVLREAKLEQERDEAKGEIIHLERERDEARDEILGWRNKWDCAIEMAARAENALDEMTLRWERTNDALFDERALADRLARIVEYGIEDMDGEEPEFLTDAKKALAAWKEARK